MSPQQRHLSRASLVLVTAMLFTPGPHSAARAIQAPDPLAQARALYMQNKLADALPLFQAVVAKEPDGADPHAWLAETARRLREFDRAADAARTALRIAPCHAFAHHVLGELYRPQWSGWGNVNADSAWTHLTRAAACDASDGNPWTGIWGEALRRGDSSIETKALRRMVETKFLVPSVLAYGRWLLRGLPQDAVLVTAGDLDTWGALAVQTTEQFRTDIAIVNSSMLNIDWYARRMSNRYGLHLATSPHPTGGASDATLAPWRAKSLDGALRRPLAATLAQPTGSGRFAFAGSYWVLTPRDSVVDPTVIQRAFERVLGRDFSLPVVSQQDRSPIRRRSWIPETVLVAAFHYADILRRASRTEDAARTEAWAQAFAREARVPSRSVEDLRQFALDSTIANCGNGSICKRPRLP